MSSFVSVKCRWLAAAMLCASLAWAGRAHAQDVPAPAVLPPCPSAAEFGAVKVERVYVGPAPIADPHATPLVELRNEISVQVSPLTPLLARERCSITHAKIVLFLDGRPVPGAAPYPRVDPASRTLRFVLQRDDTSRELWTHLLGRPSYADRPVAVSVGIEDEYPIASDQTVNLRSIPRTWFWIWVVALGLLFIAFFLLAQKSDILRDTGPQPAGARKPYSLAKMQAAWWFFLILASYLFIGLISGDYGTTITSTVLVLMGISAATAVGSATIDAGKVAAASAAAGANVPVAPALSTRGHWWLDILSDEDGVNFHRFQMAAWTGVLGLIFIHDVYVGLAMPTFDNTLLGLLGISAGTYLGLKTTSEKTP